MPPDKDDTDDTITDKTDSYKPINMPLNDVNTDKTCIKHKTNKVSDITRQTHEPAAVSHLNENHIDKQRNLKKKIQFNCDVRVKDSANHGYMLDKLSDNEKSNEMSYAIEDDDDAYNEATETGVSMIGSLYIPYVYILMCVM